MSASDWRAAARRLLLRSRPARVLQFSIPSDQDGIVQLCSRVLTEVYSMRRGDDLDYHFLRKVRRWIVIQCDCEPYELFIPRTTRPALSSHERVPTVGPQSTIPRGAGPVGRRLAQRNRALWPVWSQRLGDGRDFGFGRPPYGSGMNWNSCTRRYPAREFWNRMSPTSESV